MDRSSRDVDTTQRARLAVYCSTGLMPDSVEHKLPPFPPIEPPGRAPSFMDPRTLGGTEIAAVSRTLSPAVVLAAYRRGIFPWPVSQRIVPWVSPDPRAVYLLEPEPHWSRSLRRTLRSGAFRVTFDQAFADVMRACGTERAEGTWITPDVLSTYETLHALGWAHSVEVWATDTNELVGGLYGLAVGALFAGESMFHRRTDASKIAFVAAVSHCRSRGFAMFDVQVLTDHLASLGCIAIPRTEFLDRLGSALQQMARFGDDHG